MNKNTHTRTQKEKFVCAGWRAFAFVEFSTATPVDCLEWPQRVARSNWRARATPGDYTTCAENPLAVCTGAISCELPSQKSHQLDSPVSHLFRLITGIFFSNRQSRIAAATPRAASSKNVDILSTSCICIKKKLIKLVDKTSSLLMSNSNELIISQIKKKHLWLVLRNAAREQTIQKCMNCNLRWNALTPMVIYEVVGRLPKGQLSNDNRHWIKLQSVEKSCAGCFIFHAKLARGLFNGSGSLDVSAGAWRAGNGEYERKFGGSCSVQPRARKRQIAKSCSGSSGLGSVGGWMISGRVISNYTRGTVGIVGARQGPGLFILFKRRASPERNSCPSFAPATSGRCCPNTSLSSAGDA